MSRKKTKAPVYKQWQGNKYTDQAKANVDIYGDWIANNWENLSRTYTPEDMTNLVQKAYDTTLSDFSQEYNKQANAIASRNYNRFGGLGSTPALYTQDMFNKQMNDYNARLMSQMYGMADQLASNQMNRNLASLNQVYGMHNDAGNIMNAVDQYNLKIINQNELNRVMAHNQNAQSGWSFGNMLSGAASGAIQGGLKGGGFGALAGGILGGVAGGLSGYSRANGYQAGRLGANFGNIGGNTINWLKNKGQGFQWQY